MAKLTRLSAACALCGLMASTAATVRAHTPNSAAAVPLNPYAQLFAATLERGQDAATNASSQLRATLDDALQTKQVARLMIVLKCDHYDVIEVIYRDGSIRVVDDPRAPIGRNEPVDRDQLNSLAVSFPGFTWGELECEY